MLSISESSGRIRSSDWFLIGFVVLIGAFFRFWGLSNIGLHGDEETMGLAVKGILDTGSPTLPSGMYYARGLIHNYLMSATAQIFGLTEWALRLPSALVGTAMVFASYFLGRRFLPSDWALVFALVIALSPAMIGISQTARMYVFYVTFIVVFAIMIFRWERTDSLLDYTFAFLVFVFALHFHRLSVFSAFLFFWPGLVKFSVRHLALGLIAFIAGLFAYKFLSDWSSSHYIAGVDFSNRDQDVPNALLDQLWFIELPILGLLLFISVACSAVVVFLFAIRSVSWQSNRTEGIVIVLSFTATIIGAAFMQYHIALLFLAAGSVFYLRRDCPAKWLVALAGLVFMLGALQLAIVYGGDVLDRPKEAVMDFLGQPNPWPYLRFAAFFPLAIIVYLVLFANYVSSFVRGAQIPDHVLLALVGVWLPVFLIGFFEGHIPLRYVIAFVPLFILSVLAAIYDAYSGWSKRRQAGTLRLIALTAAVLVVFIRPGEFWANINPQYEDYASLGGHRGADHKGASEFVRSLDLGSSDILVAEDVLQQTYYLGKVDYWLRKFTYYTYLKGDEYSDIYTGTPHLGNEELLRELIEKEDRGDIIIIGSAETARDPSYYLGDEIVMLLEESQPEVLHKGRDGMTVVLRIAAPDR